MTSTSARLGPAGILILEGIDAMAFAHAQFTSNVNELAVGTWQWSAWLDAQGRARHFFALLRTESTQLLAWLPLGDAADMRGALARFVFRSKLTLAAPGEWALHALPPSDLSAPISAREVTAHRAGYALALPGSTQRIAWLAPSADTSIATRALSEWRAHDIAARLPLLASESNGQFVPQALDLERLDAIRFDKGCYPGQEVAARLHFRGGNKRHLLRLAIDGAAPAAGTPIMADTTHTAGHVLYSSATSTRASEALAVIADADAESARLATASGSIVSVVLK